MFLLPGGIALVGRLRVIEQRRVVWVVVLKSIRESQHVHHHQVGDGIQDRDFRIQDQHGEIQAAAYRDDREIPRTLVAPLGNDEGREHHDEVHDQVVRRNIEPFQRPGQPQRERMPREPLVVLEPDDIVVVDMMAEVLVAHVFVGAIGGPAEPAHQAAQPGVMLAPAEDQVMAALVYQVCGNHHRMCEQQCGNDVDRPRSMKEPGESEDIAGYGISNRQAVVDLTLRFPEYRGQHSSASIRLHQPSAKGSPHP